MTNESPDSRSTGDLRHTQKSLGRILVSRRAVLKGDRHDSDQRVSRNRDVGYYSP
jgi:hypothetical protein